MTTKPADSAIPASTAERIALIERSFSAQTVPTVPLPVTYRLGLLLLCGLMILLPLIYLGLIALVGYGLYYHAVYDATVFANVSSGKAALAIYITPLIVGVILLFFMVKPLFAPREKTASPITLEPGQEPILEDFVNRICDAVKAPKPRSIAIDGQVNASASFEDGILAFFLGRLRLTIGLPLLAGMPVHSVGGILAHEFGHFAQGGGMRLTYIIRMINNWFARVVYGRDSWDDSIEEHSKNSDFRLMILLMIARAFIFLVRKILWALMQIGNLASCYMARQMEYDADSYETRFAGSTVFSQTSERLTKLSYASQYAISQLQTHFDTKKLSDDFPSMIEHCRASFTPEQIKSIDEAQAAHKTKLLDTHPSDTDRIAHANKLDAPGIFHLDQPATLLLADYASSAREVTRHHYSEVFGLQIDGIKLLDNEQLQADEAQLQEQYKAANNFFNGVCTLEIPLELAPIDDVTAKSDQELQASLKTALQKLNSHDFNAEEFHTAVDEAFKRNTTRYFDQYPGKYGELSQDASQALSLYAAVCAKQLRDESQLGRFLARYELFRKTCSLVPDWFKIRDNLVRIQVKLDRWQNSEDATEAEVNAATRQYADPINDCFRTLAATIGKDTPLPFADDDSQLTALEFLYDKTINTSHAITDAYHRASSYLEKFHTFYQRQLGQLALDLQSIDLEGLDPEPETEEPALV